MNLFRRKEYLQPPKPEQRKMVVNLPYKPMEEEQDSPDTTPPARRRDDLVTYRLNALDRGQLEILKRIAAMDAKWTRSELEEEIKEKWSGKMKKLAIPALSTIGALGAVDTHWYKFWHTIVDFLK